MNNAGSGSGPDEEPRSWTTETLPMSVRKELLERELRKLGFRKAAGHDGPVGQQQQQPQGGSGDHPKAGGHAD
jgi:hypothetical protein